MLHDLRSHNLSPTVTTTVAAGSFNDVVIGFNDVVIGFNDVVIGFNDVVIALMT